MSSAAPKKPPFWVHHWPSPPEDWHDVPTRLSSAHPPIFFHNIIGVLDLPFGYSLQKVNISKNDSMSLTKPTKSKEMYIQTNFPDLQAWMMFRKTPMDFCGAKIQIFRMDGCIYHVINLRFCWVFSAEGANFGRDFLDVDFEHIFCINIRGAARAKVHRQGVAASTSLFEMTTWILDWAKLIEIYCTLEQGP